VSETKVQKLANLKPYQRGVTVDFKVLKTKAVRKVKSRRDGSDHQVADVLIGDQTGTLFLTLWDEEIPKVEDGKTFRIVKGQTGLFQGRLQLSLGRNGSLAVSPTTISEVNTERELSAKSHASARGKKDGRGGPEKQNPPIRRSRGFKWSRIERKSD
jgi:replication factor A1